jgi:hypothetical protein
MNCHRGILVFLFLVAGNIFSCSDCNHDEILRSKSPTGELDAVLRAEFCGGAAGSVVYEVYVVLSSKSANYSKEERVLRVTHFEGYSLHWKDPRTLEIEYGNGQIYSFINFLYFSKEDKSREIEIVLKKKY